MEIIVFIFGGVVAFFIFLTFLTWLCDVGFRYFTDEYVDSSIAEAYDDNDQAFEIECMGNPNVEVKIDFIILILNR